jgi:cyclic pyranopterin phosphate synthase
MVDVGAKPVTQRAATAEATVRISPETARTLSEGNAPKGDVLGTARLAGIQGAKRAADLVPLAHPIPIDHVDVEVTLDVDAGAVLIRAEVRTSARTGVEIEAMTACSVAALTVYDMVKGIERGAKVDEIALVSKSGGRHDWSA